MGERHTLVELINDLNERERWSLANHFIFNKTTRGVERRKPVKVELCDEDSEHVRIAYQQAGRTHKRYVTVSEFLAWYKERISRANTLL